MPAWGAACAAMASQTCAIWSRYSKAKSPRPRSGIGVQFAVEYAENAGGEGGDLAWPGAIAGRRLPANELIMRQYDGRRGAAQLRPDLDAGPALRCHAKARTEARAQPPRQRARPLCVRYELARIHASCDHDG